MTNRLNRRKFLLQGLSCPAIWTANSASAIECGLSDCVLMSDQDIINVFGNLPPATDAPESKTAFYRIKEFPNNPSLREEVGSYLTFFGNLFEVQPAFSIYDDSDFKQALAFRRELIPGKFGGILFGRRLLEELSSEKDLRYSVLPMILAHEFGHILQLKMNCDRVFSTWRTGSSRENHADYLAGWAISRLQIQLPTLNVAAMRSFLSRNASDSNTPWWWSVGGGRRYGTSYFRTTSFSNGLKFLETARGYFGRSDFTSSEVALIGILSTQNPGTFHPQDRKRLYDIWEERHRDPELLCDGGATIVRRLPGYFEYFD